MKTRIILLMLLLVFCGCSALNIYFIAGESQVAAECDPTPTDQEGPYYTANTPFKDDLYPTGAPGTRLIISGVVQDTQCQPLAGALVDVWQADANGVYDFSDQFIGRRRVTTDENGRYQFETVLPGEYVPRPPHIHFKIIHPDLPALTTQLYFVGNSNGGVHPALIISLEADGDGLRGSFDIVLAA